MCWIGEMVFSMIVFVGQEAGHDFGLHGEGFIDGLVELLSLAWIRY